MVFGAIVYTLFTTISPLVPIGEAVGPYVVKILPIVIFLMLYVTFCKIQIDDLRPRAWHFWLQGIRVALSAIMVLAISLVDSPETKIILEGVFICVICPTAAARDNREAGRKHRLADHLHDNSQLRYIYNHSSLLPDG